MAFGAVGEAAIFEQLFCCCCGDPLAVGATGATTVPDPFVVEGFAVADPFTGKLLLLLVLFVVLVLLLLLLLARSDIEAR